jgi:hypothetical protein
MAMSFEDLQAQVELLTAALQSQGMGGTLGQRSPVLGPHTNLLSPPPSAKVAKQNFFYDGMDLPSTRTDFPVLRFRLTETGVQEKCCKNQKEVDALGDEWVTTPPTMDLPSPLEALEDAMASLNEDEKRMVMEEQKKVRLGAIQSQLAALSEDELATLSGIPVKRKPGRPKKVD